MNLMSAFKDEILFLSEEDVLGLLTPGDAIAAVERTFASLGNGQLVQLETRPLWLDDNYDNMIIPLAAFIKDIHIVGMKWVNFFIKQQPGYPSSHGNLIIINDARNGSPLALVGASNITAMRTAGGHAVVAAKYLSVKHPETLAIIGCGVEGRSGVRGFLTEFPLKRIRVSDLRMESMQHIEQEFGNKCEIEICASPQKAVEGSQIVLTATSSKKPLVMFDWVEPGTTIIGLTAFHDLDPNFSRKAEKWVLGCKDADKLGVVERPEFIKHNLSMDNVYGDLGQVVAGKIPGRENEGEIIVYTHMGMGALDVACAYTVYQRALEKGIGHKIIL